MIKVVLVDDHVVVRSGFAQLLNLEEDLVVEGQFSSAAEAWPALSRNDIDVAVMDVAMPDENGLSLLKRLRQQRPTFRAIILSIYDTPAFVQSALDAGASGYLTKRCGRKSWCRRCVPSAWAGITCAPMRKALRGGEPTPKALEALTRASAKCLSCW
jgi:two-component system uhpT operon response regulator UhpA